MSAVSARPAGGDVPETSAANPPQTPPLDGLRVCIVGLNYAPEPSGIAPYTTALARAAVGAGAHVRVITGMPHYPWWQVPRQYRRAWRRDETDQGVSVSRRRHWVPPKSSLLGRLALEASFLVHVAPSVLASRADVVVAVIPSASGPMAALAAHRGRPWGAIVQDLMGNAAGQSGTTAHGVSGALAAIEYGVLRRADLVGVITPRFGTILRDHGVDAAKIVDVPNFSHVAASTLTRDEARRRLGWPLDRFLVVHTGNIGRKQGLEVLVDVAKLCESDGSDIDVVIVGDGNQRDEIRARAGSCSHLRFVDPLDDPDYPAALSAADVLAITERPGVLEMSLPSKLTSYVTVGRPIIASVAPDGITGEYLASRGIALCVPPGDPRALISGIERLRTDGGLAAKLVAAGTQLHHDELGAEAGASRYVNFLADLARR